MIEWWRCRSGFDRVDIGAKGGIILLLYAALKRRSSTVLDEVIARSWFSSLQS